MPVRDPRRTVFIRDLSELRALTVFRRDAGQHRGIGGDGRISHTSRGHTAVTKDCARDYEMKLDSFWESQAITNLRPLTGRAQDPDGTSCPTLRCQTERTVGTNLKFIMSPAPSNPL